MIQIREIHLYILLGCLIAAFAVTGFAVQGVDETLHGLWRIQTHPARLLNDFTLVGGAGAALVNAALVAGTGVALVGVVNVRLSGPTIAAVFTMFGFGLFGKTPLNIAPILIGVLIAARLARKSYAEYILMALFGTALGPLVTALAVEAGLATVPALAISTAGGVLAGVLLPGVAISMLRLHQGFNLYNIGLACGFIGLFGASVLVAAGQAPGASLVWGSDWSPVLFYLAPAVSAVLLLFGFAAGPRSAVTDVGRIMRLSGRLPSDFVSMVSVEGALVNAGLMGFLTWGYVLIVGGDLNGPVLGGIFTAVGFATFGKHPRNSWSVLAGGLTATLLVAVIEWFRANRRERGFRSGDRQ